MDDPTSMRRVYVAHPLGHGEDREANRLDAMLWCAAIGELDGYAPIADWIILSGVWDESKRERGLAIDLAIIEGCDELWMVGPRISPGMRIEAAYAKKRGKRVWDITGIERESLADVLRKTEAIRRAQVEGPCPF